MGAGAGPRLSEGPRGPGPGERHLSSVDLAALRRPLEWRVGATDALSSLTSSRRRRVFSPRARGSGRTRSGGKALDLKSVDLVLRPLSSSVGFVEVTEPQFPFL